jgi:hypothetical protein
MTLKIGKTLCRHQAPRRPNTSIGVGAARLPGANDHHLADVLFAD